MTNSTYTVNADLSDLMELSGLPWYPTRWGKAQIDLPDDDNTIRVSEDDGTFYVVALSGGSAELIHTEARFSGIAAQALVLATLDALMLELSL